MKGLVFGMKNAKRCGATIVVAVLLLVTIACVQGTAAEPNPDDWKEEVRARVAHLAPEAEDKVDAASRRTASYDGADVVAGQYLVKPADGFQAADLGSGLAPLEGRVLKALEAAGLLLVELPEVFDTDQALELLRSLSWVETAEPNLFRHFRLIPNDPYRSSQWHLSHINAFSAWDITTGSGTVVLADIDSGLRRSHEDFAGGVTSGRVLTGYNSIDGSTNVADDVGHGTMTAGCSSAETDNNLGIAGTGWQTSLLPIKAGNTLGISLDAEAEALYYAADHGADVINMSFGSQEYSALEQAAVDYAVEQGCILVAARGNEGHSDLDFPACLQNVIGVGSTGATDQPSSFTDYGMGTDVMAPGEGIFTTGTDSDTKYVSFTGTSFSTPIVSGEAALVLGDDPGLTAAEVEYLIEEGAAGMSDKAYGYGLIDMAGSLTVLNGYTDTLEPNNTVNQAVPIESGIYQSYMGCNSDSDFFSFTPGQTGMMYGLLDGVPADCDFDLFLHQVDKAGDWNEIIAYSTGGLGQPEGFVAPVQAGVEYALEVQCAFRFSDEPYTLFLIEPEIAKEWYFAEGYTGAGFDQWLCLQNPGDTTITIHSEYMFTSGTVEERDYQVQPHSRRTVDVNAEVGEGRELSTRLTSTMPFIAERPMYFNYNGAWPGGHDLMGVTTPSSVWFFAEGTTRPGFDEWLCLQNPNGWGTEAEVSFNGPGLSTSKTFGLPANTRTTIPVDAYIGEGYDVSMAVLTGDGNSDGTDDLIVAERPMYFLYGGAWAGGHISSGSTFSAYDWYFAEGYTGAGFEEWLCLQNPGDSAAVVSVTYMFDNGGSTTMDYDVPANSRYTIRVNDEVGPDRNVSMHAFSDSPFIAERPMYFSYRGQWEGGHVVTGALNPSVSWYFAEGYTGPGFEEWLCLQNPASDSATIEIRYMLSDGTVVPQAFTVSPSSRSTIYVNDVVGANRELSIEIISDVPVVAERPIYFLYQGWCPGGDNVMGYTP